MEKNEANLYDIFMNYSYSQLKALFKNAKTKEEQDFYIDYLCKIYWYCKLDTSKVPDMYPAVLSCTDLTKLTGQLLLLVQNAESRKRVVALG